HEQEVDLLLNLQEKGELPVRIVQNDTKINNVMLDTETDRAVCVIDLDTVMPGSILYDFGDMARTMTSPAAEDEEDLEKTFMRMPMFEAVVKGYLETAKDFITPLEVSLLPFSGKLITLETGIRFLTDYLSGDVYFKIHRPEHNLDRCRTQMALVESIEAQMDEMKAVVDRY
ncbi:phosphotransferase, partial [Bacteroides caccae]|uniref:phosphotransferase n=1 Tax=Bacteroides caccae TaxID=47678 RepID=UPI0012309995